jgi:hypothetical protein
LKGGSAELTPSNWSLTPALSEGVRVAAGLHSTPALPNIRVWPFASNLNVRCSVAFGGESFAKPFWDPKRGTLFQIKPGLGNFDSKKLLLRVPLLPISVAEHPFAEFCNTVGGKARNPSQSGDPATDYSLRPHSVFNSIALSLAARHLSGARESLAARSAITREKTMIGKMKLALLAAIAAASIASPALAQTSSHRIHPGHTPYAYGWKGNAVRDQPLYNSFAIPDTTSFPSAADFGGMGH